MDRKPGKRRLTWMGNNRPPARDGSSIPGAPHSSQTRGKLWQDEPRGRGETNSWLVGEPSASSKPSPQQPDFKALPKLPSWPPLPGEDRFAATSASSGRYARYNSRRDISHDSASDDTYTDEHEAQNRDQPRADLDDVREGKIRALWSFIATPLKRPRVAFMAIAGLVTLLSILGVVSLGSALLHDAPKSTLGTSGIGGANTVVLSPTAGHATPRALATNTAAPKATQPPTPLTVSFTCASGVVGGNAQLCVHTLPNAALGLTVRYCDGSYAKGKEFHGISNADGSGNFTWQWSVASSCVGNATATVTASAAGQTVTQHTTLPITQ